MIKNRVKNRPDNRIKNRLDNGMLNRTKNRLDNSMYNRTKNGMHNRIVHGLNMLHVYYMGPIYNTGMALVAHTKNKADSQETD
jgi:hypothetical protein